MFLLYIVILYSYELVQARFVSSLYGAYHLQGFVNLNGKFNSIVMMLKPVTVYAPLIMAPM
jgi:hypothetical protein